MDSFFERYRNLVVLLVILLAQLIGLAVQVRRNGAGQNTLDSGDSSSVRLIRLWSNAIVSPPERLFHGGKTGIVGVWSNYFDLRHVRQENRDLVSEVSRLRLEQAALLEDARQGQRLQALLGFQEKYIYKTVAAQVYGSSGSDHSRVFYIDKGAHEGLKPDMAVITGDGIVGKVRDVFQHTAQVLAVNDTTSGAGVILETTRIRGILKGDAEGRLEVVGIMADQRIQPGEKVLTAGGDLIFPRGLPVGVVQKIERDPERDGFINILLQPAAHLDRLDEVLVITSTEPRFSPEQQKDIDASASQAANVPTAIKDQMKASEIMAEKLPGLVDPSLPPDKQPLNDTSNPNPAPRPPQPLHPDQFSPGSAVNPVPAPATESGSPAQSPQTNGAASVQESNDGPPPPAEKSTPDAQPQTPPQNRR